ncbi:hypothetical protein ABZ016_24500 [Streptomyces sp. NPDC006372]|uniref:hypothetical protein n=1 Tax=Streptomyces sp. NPDC006372 TaxID=3155599 RepID=UPI0033B176EB
MTTRTLWQGWWSPLSLIVGAPLALLQNFLAYRRLRQLPPTCGLSVWRRWW